MKTNELITERIISLLEKDIVPWRKPWSENAGLGEHQNLVTQHQYKGINAIVTASSGFSSNYWLSFKQAQEFGATVKKGEKATPIVYWCFGTKKDENDVEEKWAAPKYSSVFNLDQIEGEKLHAIVAKYKNKQKRIDFNPIESCEKIIQNYKTMPKLQFKMQRACYSPKNDWINMPVKESFVSVESYYQTLFHEMTHSTGHESRLARNEVMKNQHFGSEDYSKEELVAELGAAFLCQKAGINSDNHEQSAAYIKSWIKALKNDSNMIIQAASRAQKAFDFICGVQQNESEAKS